MLTPAKENGSQSDSPPLACHAPGVQSAAMRAREVLDRTHTPDRQPLELAREAGHYVIRVSGIPLMSSAAFGSEQAMARIAHDLLGERAHSQVLVGGLGMGFTLRAVLDTFAADACVTVAELLPSLVGYSRDVLGHLAGYPLADPRVRLHQGDVRVSIAQQRWDVILLDVDNGPDALTTAGNASLYSAAGVLRLSRALTPGGVLVIWSAFESRRFEERLRSTGLSCETRKVRARADVGKGAIHTLFVAHAPS